MKDNENKKLVAAIVIAALIAPSALALGWNVCVDTVNPPTQNTSGCSSGGGCTEVVDRGGTCKKNSWNPFGKSCTPGKQIGLGLRQSFPGKCTKNSNQEWVCVNISTSPRDSEIRVDCNP